MDDIDFGAKSLAEGRNILGELDTELNKFGVRLNPAKTRILDTAEAAQHFLIQENRALNVLTNSLKHGSHTAASTRRISRKLSGRFTRFVGIERKGHWNKVLKRYFTLLGKLQNSVMEPFIPQFLESIPDVRDSVYSYYLRLGFSPLRYRQIFRYLTSGYCIDDVSLFGAANLLVQWHIPATSGYRNAVIKLAWRLIRERNTMTKVISGLWLVAKYGTQRQLWLYLRKTETIWIRTEWASRQVAAASPRLHPRNRDKLRRLIGAAGLLQGLHVITNLEDMRSLRTLDTQLRTYLRHPPAEPYPYPFPKILVALNSISGDLAIAAKRRLCDDISALTQDTVFHELLTAVRP
jgi:hypothetical protein